MKNIGKKAKRNPWRNTRNDFKMPWHDIMAATFMAILPIVILLFASNFVMRSSTFYSFYLSKTEVIKEIPYAIENQDLTKTFGDFMIHKDGTFKLKEKSEYMPQQVFSQRDAQVMETIRFILDCMLVAGVILLIGSIALAVYLCIKEEKKLLYESFKNSWIWFVVLLIANGVCNFVKPVRELIFKVLFGVRFPPGDVLIQIFETKFTLYYGMTQIIVSCALMGIVLYIMNKFVNKHKMFKL